MVYHPVPFSLAPRALAFQPIYTATVTSTIRIIQLCGNRGFMKKIRVLDALMNILFLL